jgi:hypothetical protein
MGVMGGDTSELPNFLLLFRTLTKGLKIRGVMGVMGGDTSRGVSLLRKSLDP